MKNHFFWNQHQILHILFSRRNCSVFLLTVFICFITTPQSTPTKADESTPHPLYLPIVSYSNYISAHLAMLNLSRVTGFTNYLVNYYGPRHHDYHKAFVDRKCTLGGTYYSNSNLIRIIQLCEAIFGRIRILHYQRIY